MNTDFYRHDMETIVDQTAERRRQHAQNRAVMRSKLTTYRTLRNRIDHLQRLRAQLENDLLNPLGAARIKLAPSRSIGAVSDPVLAPVVRLDDIQTKIAAQLEEAQQELFKLLCVIDLLPPDSQERDVIELHYLDGKTLRQIEQLRYISQATIVRAEARGIDELLVSDRARELLGVNIDQQ